MIFPRAAEFPKCNKYLRDEMPKVVRVPRIANAMRELGRLDGALFARALKPGTQPTLTLFDKPMPYDSILGERWLIPRDQSGRMVLNVSLFEDFETQSGKRLKGDAHVSARPGSPGAREFNGTFDRRGIIQTLGGGPPHPGLDTHSIGHYREKALFRFGACILGALVDWGLWSQEGRADEKAATRFAVHAYRSLDVF
ncbi:MAG: hypothetical protein IPL03_11690 [Sterolibacteriaceae bacterium]|nr:hypothetical protein [Candidatus Methylophosphatis haderslevensis]